MNWYNGTIYLTYVGLSWEIGFIFCTSHVDMLQIPTQALPKQLRPSHWQPPTHHLGSQSARSQVHGPMLPSTGDEIREERSQSSTSHFLSRTRDCFEATLEKSTGVAWHSFSALSKHPASRVVSHLRSPLPKTKSIQQIHKQHQPHLSQGQWITMSIGSTHLHIQWIQTGHICEWDASRLSRRSPWWWITDVMSQ